MKRTLLLVFTIILCNYSFAQTPTLQQKLYYTCKVWGFVKYYHSNVSTCNVNWDSVLVSVLPTVEGAATDSAFNDVLDTMIAAAGPMALSSTYFPDTLPANLKFNRDWGWIDSSSLRSDVQVQLDTIRNNFRPHAECWVQNNTYTTSYDGLLVFPHDDTELNVNTYTSYPDADSLLLMFFKYWNVVRYFYPYTYVLDTSWDTTLSHYVLPIANAPNSQAFYLLYLKIATHLDDAHVYGYTASNEYQELPGFYMPYIRLKYVDSQYVVINSLVAGIHIGDAIISVDGLTTAQWEDSLKPYYSSGNLSVFRRSMCASMLGRQYNGAIESILVQDSTGTNHTVMGTCVDWYYLNPSFFDSYIYPADSLNTINWTTMACDIGYINIGNISIAGIDSAYAALYNSPAIIVDIRNYPISNSGFELLSLITSSPTYFADLTLPDVTYPGTYYWQQEYNYPYGTYPPYSGKIIVLMNETTQSAAEYDCMGLSSYSRTIKVGSQTAGADGNISYWNLSQDLYAGMTTLGVFYPNGDSTQRIGIVPDSVVYPTRAGIRHGDDEVLDKALQIAGCNLYVKNTQLPQATISIFPNPATTELSVRSTGQQINQITITDLLGQSVYNQSCNSSQVNINVAGLPAGVYLVKINGVQVNKFVKE